MIKIILMFIVFVFAAVIAMALLGRLLKMQEQLADLHRKLKTNDDEMARHRRDIERISAQNDASQEN